MGAMKNIRLEIENSSALSYMMREIEASRIRITELEAMLSEICHNLHAPDRVEALYQDRYETTMEESTC